MEKLTGYGAPHNHLVGEVGQHYEDLNTGDIYECRIAQKYSPTHGWPVGGYVWELRARGEDIKEIYGSSGQSAGGSGVLQTIDLSTMPDPEGVELSPEVSTLLNSVGFNPFIGVYGDPTGMGYVKAVFSVVGDRAGRYISAYVEGGRHLVNMGGTWMFFNK